MTAEICLQHDQIVSGRLQRQEIQAERLSCRPDADANICLMPRNGPCHIKMRREDGVISTNVAAIEACCTQTLIEKEPSPGAFLPVYQCDTRFTKIGCGSDSFWISRPNEEA